MYCTVQGSKKGKAAKGRKKGKPTRPRYQRTKEALWDGSWLVLSADCFAVGVASALQ